MALRAEDNGWKVEASDTDVSRAEARLAGIPEKTHKWIESALQAAAERGAVVMAAGAPVGEPRVPYPNPEKMSPQSLASQKHVSLRTRIRAGTLEAERDEFLPSVGRYQPGGAGGGGSYSITFGPIPRPQYKDNPTHDPAYIVRVGSGIKGKNPTGLIRPKTGNFLTFMDGPKQEFVRFIRGQKAQDAWFIAGLQAARAVLRSRTQALNL